MNFIDMLLRKLSMARRTSRSLSLLTQESKVSVSSDILLSRSIDTSSLPQCCVLFIFISSEQKYLSNVEQSSLETNGACNKI